MASVRALTREELEARVLKAPGPVAIDFYQASCPPCRVLEPRLERVARQYRGRVPIYRVDIDRDMPVAERFRVMSIPTVLVFRDGKEIERVDGPISETHLREAFERVLRDKGGLAEAGRKPWQKSR